MLKDLPSEAGGQISDANKLGVKMADALLAQQQRDILLRQEGTPLDPKILFGLGGNKTRVSVLNFIGLQGIASQRQFLNQLAMTLFSWIKKHPAPQSKPLTGLLVIDEAKDFLPSTKASICKESVMRLAAQARKYGLGLVLATQAPKDIEHTILSNCFTHLYGKASSPAAIDALQKLLKEKGASGSDIGTMGRGQFYLSTIPEITPQPTKIATSLCLSHHPSSPLDQEGVLERAKR